MPHKFRQAQADKLVAIRRGMDRGTATETQLIAAAGEQGE